MNIIEAIKSGRRFRRKSQSNQGPWYQEGSGIRFYEDDILADDWEVEATPVTITREQFDTVFTTVFGGKYLVQELDYLRERLAKELGL